MQNTKDGNQSNINAESQPIRTLYVLLRSLQFDNVFWTTDDGSNHEGFEVIFRGNDPEEMIKRWEKYNKFS